MHVKATPTNSIGRLLRKILDFKASLHVQGEWYGQSSRVMGIDPAGEFWSEYNWYNKGPGELFNPVDRSRK
jgi:hypothetical protein